MERRDLLAAVFITAGLYSLNIILDLLTGIALPAPLLVSILTSTGYLLYRQSIDAEEVATSSAAFIGSGLVVSYALKQTVYRDLCATAKNLPDSSDVVLTGQEACKSTFEIFGSALDSSPVENWVFWAVSLTASALTLYIYRKHYRTNSETDTEPETSSNTFP